MILTYVLAFLAAHRAFIIADNFFLRASLIGLRPARFLGAGLAFFGADLPFHFDQRCFIAAEIRSRAAGLMRRRFLPAAGSVCFTLGGRPRRAGEASPSRAEMAWSIRLRSVLRSESKLWISTNVLSTDVVATDCSRRVRSSHAFASFDDSINILPLSGVSGETEEVLYFNSVLVNS